MSTYKLTPQQRKARAQALVAQRNAISKAKTNYTPTVAASQAQSAPKKDTNFLLRLTATNLDMSANILTGALKSIEGIYDLGAGLVGAVGGIFSEDFREGVQDHIEYDAIGEWVGNPLDELLSDSYLEDSKAGQITEAVMQGVGQMLPAVIVTVMTAGAGAPTAISQAAGLVTTGVSAAGTSTEDAYKDGADYYQGLGYGVAAGGVEAATEKLTGGIPVFGKGMLDDVGKAIVKESAEGAVKAGAKVGAQRVVKNMVDEAAEEAIAELANPALKSIYKGKDAFTEYGESDYWAGVGESALVGGLTSAVYGGTLGKVKKLGGSSSIESDAREVAEDIDARKKQIRRLSANGKLTQGQAVNAQKVIKADMELLEKQMQKASPKARAKALESGLGVNFDENGNLRPEIREKLDKNIQAASDTTYDYRYRSVDLDADTITEVLAKKEASAFSGELDEKQTDNLKEMTRALNAMSEKSGNSISFVLANKIAGKEAYYDPDKHVIVMGIDQLASNESVTEVAKKWIGSAIHEGAHATEGTFRAGALNALLKSDNNVYSDAVSQYLSRGFSRDYLGENNDDARKKLLALIEKDESGEELTEQERDVYEEFESESYAYASQAVLGNEKFVRHLVDNDLGTVEKILGKIQDIKDAFKNRKNENTKKAAEFAKAAEKLYLSALEEVGAKYVNGKIISTNKDDEDEESTLKIKESKEPKAIHNNELNPEQKPVKKFSEYTVSTALYEAFDHKDAGDDNLIRVSRMPQYIVEKFGIEGDFYIYRDHAYENMVSEEQAKEDGRYNKKAHYHNIGLEKMTEAMLALNDATMVIKEQSRDGNPTVVMMLPVLGNNRAPLYAVLSFYSNRKINGKFEKRPHIVLTISPREFFEDGGRKGWSDIVSSAIEDNRVLDFQKERGRDLSVIAQHVKLGDITETSLRNSISQFRKEINTFKQKNKISYSQEPISKYSLSEDEKSSLKSELGQLATYDDLDRINDYHPTPPTPKEPPKEKKRYNPKATQAAGITDKQIRELISESTNSIKYTKAEAESVLYDILENNLSFGEQYGKLTGKSQQEIISMLWRGLSLTSPGKRFSTALDIAEYFLANSVIGNTQADKALELYGAWKSVLPDLDVDGLKVLTNEFEKLGIEIKGETESELRSQIESTYQKIREGVKKDTKHAFESFLSTEERNSIKQEIAKKILSAFDEKGSPSKAGELLAEMERKMHASIERYNEGREYNKTTNILLEKLKKIEDLKKGRFLSASQFKTDIFKGSIEKLAKIKSRGELNKSGTRNIIKGFTVWYDVKNNPLLSEDHYNKEVYESLQGIVNGEGDLSLQELKDLIDIIDYFYWFDKNYNKVWENGKRVDAMPKTKKFLDIIKANGELKVGFLRKFFVDRYGRTFFDPMSLVRYMDRYERGFYTEMLEQLRDGALHAQEMEMEIRQPLEEFYDIHKNFLKDIRKKTVKYQGHDIPITQAMLLYMTLNREHALAGLAVSGFTYFDGQKQIKLKGFFNESNQDLNLLDIKAKAKNIQSELSKQFTEAELEYISIAENIFNVVCKDIKRTTDMKRQGFSNVLDDYYVPIVRAMVANTVDTSSFFSEMLRVSNASFNKDIVKGAKNKLYIESLDSVLDRHIRAISLYANLATVIDDYNTLYNLDISGNPNDPQSIASESANSEWNQSVKRQVGDRVRDEANEYFKKLISDIQGISPVKCDGNRFVGMLRRNYARYQLGANPKVWITQTTSFLAAGSILDYDSLLKGFSVSGKEVDKYCSLAKLRNSENTVAKAQGVLDKTGEFGDKLMIGIGTVDRWVVTRLFAACQIQISKEKRLAIGTEENKKAAGELLKRVILETQQNSIATERSAAMRSGNEFFKTLTMFSADSMKVIGRFIDSLGEYLTLTKKKKKLSDPAAIKEIDLRLKTVKRNLAKSTASLVSSAIVMALIAQAFRTLYNKDDEEDNVWANMGIDAAGNLLGGLPLYKDFVSFFLDGYELENYAYSTVNDLLDSFRDILNINDGRSAMAAAKSVFFASGQFFGIPTRNVYNFFYGITNRISPSSTYTWDNMLYSKNYSSDLAKAIENEDEAMIATIAGLMLNENVGGIESEAARTELNRLVTEGFDVIPRGVGDTITYDGETYELTSREKKEFSKIYNIANESLTDMVKLARYKEATDEVKQKAIAFVYDVYYKLALQDFLGEDLETKTVLFAEAIDIEKLALIVATARSLTADTDKDGKTVNGSRKKKIQAYINSLHLKAAEKYMIMGYLGYSNINGEAQVKAHINKLNLTKQEKSKLLEYSGYAAS